MTQHPSTKLTARDAVSIRSLWPSETMTALGKAYGVSTVTIHKIIRFKAWKMAGVVADRG